MKKIFFLLLVIFASSLQANECERVRAAIDIGSGTTKMIVARVNTCEAKISEIIAPLDGEELEVPVRYARNLAENEQGKLVFTQEIITLGIEAMKHMAECARALGAQEITAVATSAYRNATNAEALATRIYLESGVKVHIISQTQEAILGALPAIEQSGLNKNEVAVWDIGGGSMQITAFENNQPRVYLGDFAMEDMVTSLVVANGIQATTDTVSPNPVGQQTAMSQLGIISQMARESVIAQLGASFIQSLQGRIILGIGSVHKYSNLEVTRQSTLKRFSASMLEQAIEQTAQLSDSEIFQLGLAGKAEYAPFRSAGAILTLGFMRGLGLPEVRVYGVNMANGVLVSNEYYSN